MKITVDQLLQLYPLPDDSLSTKIRKLRFLKNLHLTYYSFSLAPLTERKRDLLKNLDLLIKLLEERLQNFILEVIVPNNQIDENSS